MSALINKWKECSEDLGLEIIQPFTLKLAAEEITFLFLVKNFGGENGMIVDSDFKKFKPIQKELMNQGFGFSVLDEPRDLQNSSYQRDIMIELLNDWGWTGESYMAPEWIVSHE